VYTFVVISHNKDCCVTKIRKHINVSNAIASHTIIALLRKTDNVLKNITWRRVHETIVAVDRQKVALVIYSGVPSVACLRLQISPRHRTKGKIIF